VDGGFTSQPVFGVSLTVGFYALATLGHLRWRTQWLNPLVISATAIMLVLVAARIPVAHYQRGSELITFWLGPATVALAIPLHRQIRSWRRYVVGLVQATLAGSVVGLSIGPFVALALGADRDVVLALVPRSVTTPIAVELAKTLGAIPEITAGLVIITGLLGHVFAGRFLTLIGVHDPVARGLAVGVAAHGIGTARMLAEDETAGAASSMGMSLAGLVTGGLVGAAASTGVAGRNAALALAAKIIERLGGGMF
jgi:predicted murein hydrolase (TIGR00659 family)